MSIVLKSMTRFNMAAVLTLLVYLQADTTDTRFLAIMGLLLIPAVGTVLLEEKIESVAVLSISELLFLLLLLVPMLTGGTERERNCLLLGILVLIVSSLLSVGSGRRNLLDRPVAAEGFLFVVAYALVLLSDAGYGYVFFLYFLSVSFLLLYFYWKNYYTLKAFIKMNDGGGAESEEQVGRVNRQSLLPFLAGMLILSLLVWIPMGSQALAEKMAEGYSDVVDSVSEWFDDKPVNFEEGPGGGEQEEIQTDAALPEAEEEHLPETETNSQKTSVINIVINVIMYSIVVLMAWLLFLILRRLSRESRSLNKNEVQQEYEMTITEENNRLERKKVRRQKAHPEEAENQKIRRIYRDTIRQGLSQTEEQSRWKSDNQEVIYEALTPAELEVQAGLFEETQTIELHRLYEKARYGKKPCTREERMAAEQIVRGGI